MICHEDIMKILWWPVVWEWSQRTWEYQAEVQLGSPPQGRHRLDLLSRTWKWSSWSRLCYGIIPADIHNLKANTEDKLLDNSFWRQKLIKHLDFKIENNLVMILRIDNCQSLHHWSQGQDWRDQWSCQSRLSSASFDSTMAPKPDKKWNFR